MIRHTKTRDICYKKTAERAADLGNIRCWPGSGTSARVSRVMAFQVYDRHTLLTTPLMILQTRLVP